MKPRTAACLCIAVFTGGCGRAPGPIHHGGVVSLDYCADQMVLGLVDRARISAVSFEADSDPSFAAPTSIGVPRIRPQLEDIVRARPGVVVRSYGGSSGIDRQLRRLGIRVVQLGYPANLNETRTEMIRVSNELGAGPMLARRLARFDSQLANAAKPTPTDHRPTMLYLTPGDVTTGPGSFVAAVMDSAGYRPFRNRPGWGSLPLEAIVRRPPDRVLRAFFDGARYRQDRWSASLHPVIAKVQQLPDNVAVPGGWVACGNWLAGYAVDRLAAAQRDAQRDAR